MPGFRRPMQSQILDMYITMYGNVKYKVPIPIVGKSKEKTRKIDVRDGI